MEPVIMAVLVGIGAGLTRSVLGFLNKADIGEPYNKYKLAKSTLRGCLACVAFTITLINGEMTIKDAVMMFFVAIGADVAWKETYSIKNMVE